MVSIGYEGINNFMFHRCHKICSSDDYIKLTCANNNANRYRLFRLFVPLLYRA